MNTGEIKLHLECGERYIPGFIHIDVANYPHIDYKTDVSDLSMFKDDLVDLIYACHVLEHFKRCEIERVLTEWHRVLKPGGVLRVTVPDFEILVKVYKKYRDMELIMGTIFITLLLTLNI